jgi:hypothetical protein
MLDLFEKSENSLVEKAGYGYILEGIIESSIRWVEQVDVKKCGC